MGRTPSRFEKGFKILKQSGIFPLSQLYKNEELYLQYPVFKRGKGPFLYDYDDNRFVDFALSRGSLLLGHAPPPITSIIKSWLGRGLASGYLSSAYRNLTKTMLDAIIPDRDQSKYEKAVFLYYDSAYEAVLAFFELLYLTGRGKNNLIVSNNDDTERIPYTVPLYFRDLQTVDMASFHGVSLENIDHVFLRFGKSSEMKTVQNVIKEIRERGIPVIADAVDFESYIHILRLINWSENLDAVIFGNWVASGLSFGSVVIQKSLINELPEKGEDNHGNNRKKDRIASLYGLPPLFKLKAVQKNLSLLRKLGGITKILKKGNHFFSLLNDAYFYNLNGIVYMKENEHLRLGYKNLRANLMREGLHFPVRPWEPVAVSTVHTSVLLRSCALKINSLLDAFYH